MMKGQLHHNYSLLLSCLNRNNYPIKCTTKILLLVCFSFFFHILEEQCHPSPCGLNTKCEVIKDIPTCSCLPGYVGNPLSGCRHECDHDGDCSARDMCKNFKCVPACEQCGIGATCNTVANHRAVCECPKGYVGSPYTQCHPECYGDVDCPSNRPACFYGVCKNTCEGACGVGADCRLRGLTPVCSCPRDMTGDPFVRCRPFTKADLCEPNPCGTNAICVPGHDNTGRERPVCNCLPGHTGNPLSYCSRVKSFRVVPS